MILGAIDRCADEETAMLLGLDPEKEAVDGHAGSDQKRFEGKQVFRLDEAGKNESDPDEDDDAPDVGLGASEVHFLNPVSQGTEDDRPPRTDRSPRS